MLPLYISRFVYSMCHYNKTYPSNIQDSTDFWIYTFLPHTSPLQNNNHNPHNKYMMPDSMQSAHNTDESANCNTHHYKALDFPHTVIVQNLPYFYTITTRKPTNLL